jgi:hypothetical protein
MVSGLSPDNQALLDYVVATGRFPTRGAVLDEAIRTLRKQIDGQEPSARESTDEWIARIRAWSDSHRAVEGFVDDSRESIY